MTTNNFPVQLVVLSREYGGFDLSKVKFDFRKQSCMEKPETAMWTSTAEKNSAGYTSAWNDFLMEDNSFVADKLGYSYTEACFSGDHSKVEAFERLHLEESREYETRNILVPKAGTKVMELNMKEDFSKVPLDANGHIDWVALSKKYDGMHLTLEGVYELACLDAPLHFWDVESTVWFNTDWVDKIIPV